MTGDIYHFKCYLIHNFLQLIRARNLYLHWLSKVNGEQKSSPPFSYFVHNVHLNIKGNLSFEVPFLSFTN